MADLGELHAKLRIDSSALGETQKKAEGFSSGFKKVLEAAGLYELGKQIVDFGKDSVAAFNDAQLAQTKLTDSFAKSPQLIHANVKEFVDLAGALSEHTKYSKTSLEAATAQLSMYGLTSDQLKALVPQVADYAARTGTDLATAAETAGKAILGKGKALAAIGVHFQDLKDPQKNYVELTQALRDKVGGFADKEGKSAAGQAEIMKNRFEELKVVVGGALQPVINALLGSLTWLADHLGAILPYLLPVVGAFVAFGAAMGIQALIEGVTGAVAALNAAMDANPFMLVALAIAGVVAALVVVYEKVGAFRDFVNSAFGVVRTVAEAVFTAVSAAIGWVIKAVETVVGWSGWSTVGNVFHTGFDIVKTIVQPVVDVVEGIVGAAKNIVGWSGWGTIGGYFHAAFDGIAGFIAGVASAIADTVTGIKNVIDWLAKLGGAGPKMNLAPMIQSWTVLASGGAVGGSGSAIPRARGGPVVPFGHYRVGEQGPEDLTMGAAGGVITPLGGGNGGGGSNQVVNIYVSGSNVSPEEIGNHLVWLRKTAAI